MTQIAGLALQRLPYNGVFLRMIEATVRHKIANRSALILRNDRVELLAFEDGEGGEEPFRGLYG